jgi:hypothetical protein
MDGKNALVVALVAVVAILAKGTLDRTTAGAGGGTAASKPAPGPAAADAPDAKAPAGGSGGTPSTDPKPACASDPDLRAQLERDFPGVASMEPAAATSPGAAAPPLHVLLASLPSPLEPALAADFDRGVEAIERAVQSQRYVPQRRWLPWREKAAAGKPGWLLFRRDRQDQDDKDRKVSIELLLVLVVSERPGSGVERPELHGALAQLEALSKLPTASAADVLVLGPTYSGTAESLVQQARAWCGTCGESFCRARALVALSGTATRPRTKAIIEGLTGVFKESRFAATVLPDNLLVAGMHRFIEQRLQVAADRIADLTETSTDYGNAVAIDRPGAPSLKIGLPLNVPQLAQASSDSRTAPTPLANGKGIELASTFATLSRKGIDHVGILTTATSEKVFLVSRLRDAAPDLRVYVYESSLELADPTKRRSLEGLMVASSYPVFAETQLWNKGAAPLVQFPSDAAQGIYNAVLGLLSRFDGDLKSALPAKLLDYVSPFCRDVPGPSVWVSASISGQLWPLAVYAQALAADSKVATCEQAAKVAIDPYLYDPRPGATAGAVERPPLPIHASFPTMIGAVVVLALLIGNAIGFTRDFPTATWRRFLVSYDPSDAQSPPFAADGPRHSVAMLGLWTLAITAFVMGKVLDLPGALAAATADNTFLRFLARILIWGAFGLVFTACVLSFRRRRGGKDDAARKQRQASAWIQAVMCALLLLAILIFPLPSVRHPDGHAYFFFVRATDPGIGLTPTLPLFMVGITIYGAALLRLIVVRRADRLEKEGRDWNPESWNPPPEAVPGPRSLSTCADAIGRFAAASSRSLLPACVAGTVLGAVVLYLTPMQLGSLEGRRFDLGCSICFALIFTLTLAAAWRAHSLWVRLRDFTRALAIHPASAALVRLPSSVAERFRSPVPGQVGNQQIDVALAMTTRALGKTTTPAISELVTALHDRWFPVAAGKAADAPGAHGGPPPLQKRSAEDLQEDLLALRMADVLGLMCDATRTMLFVATGTGLAALLGCALYPFQPAASLAAAGLVSVGLVVVVALRVLLGIERDKVLSEVGGTQPGKVTPSLGLFTRLVGYVVVPLGGLIGSRMQDPGSVIELLKSLTNALNR